MKTLATVTHEVYIKAVAEAAIAQLPADEQAKLRAVKLVYGAGSSGLRGITYFNKWSDGSDAAAPFCEVCAFGQESHVQVAGTTIHELAHALAGFEAAHGKGWKTACEKLGLRHARAAGHAYHLADFVPAVRMAIAAMPKPDEGEPVTNLPVNRIGKRAIKACTFGIGSKGGKSRGVGSGSRMLKYTCDHGQIIRAATSELQCTCGVCHSAFKLA